MRGAIDLTLIAGELLNLDMERTRDSVELAHGSGPGQAVTDGDNEKQYRETVYDAMVVALSGRIFLDETVDLTPEQVLRQIWEDHFILDPADGGARLKSDRGRLADHPPRASAAGGATPTRAGSNRCAASPRR